MSAPPADGVVVDPVRTRADLRDFVALPLQLHPRTHHVPLWQDTITRWWRGVGPHTTQGPVDLLLARDADGQVVGRTTLHTDTRLDARVGRPVQLLGATEFTDPAALAAMTGTAVERARRDGREGLLGPVSLLPNQTGGVITSGFADRGFVDSPWNPSWYPAAWEAAGFTRRWPASTWICADLPSLDPDRVFPTGAPGTPRRDAVTLHRGRRRDLDAQLPLLLEMLNASFAELPYYTPITMPELREATDGLAWVLDERLLLWAERDGVPVGFVLTVPDLSEFVMSTGGRMRPLDQVRLLLTRRRYRRDAVLIVKGTVPAARGEGVMSVLSHALLQGLRDGGYERLRVTFIGEDNHASAAQFAAMGGRPLHDARFYERPVDP